MPKTSTEIAERLGYSRARIDAMTAWLDGGERGLEMWFRGGLEEMKMIDGNTAAERNHQDEFDSEWEGLRARMETILLADPELMADAAADDPGLRWALAEIACKWFLSSQPVERHAIETLNEAVDRLADQWRDDF